MLYQREDAAREITSLPPSPSLKGGLDKIRGSDYSLAATAPARTKHSNLRRSDSNPVRCGFALVPSSNTTSDGRHPEPEPLLHPSPVFVLRVDVDLEGERMAILL